MAWLASKYLITAAIVVIVSEAAKRSDRLGGFIATLPASKVAKQAWYTFWYVLPTLPMFLVFPALGHLGFWPTLAGRIWRSSWRAASDALGPPRSHWR